VAGHRSQLRLDGYRKLRLSGRADRLQERLPVGEVPVSRVRSDPGTSGGLPQHDRVGSASAGQLGASLHQRTV
jgi:hypothetical protein